MLAGHDQHTRLARQRANLRRHLELLAHVREQLVQRLRVGQVIGGCKVNAHEEQACAVFALHITKLLRVDDVAARLVQQARDGVNNARGVNTGQRENEFVRGLHDCRRL